MKAFGPVPSRRLGRRAKVEKAREIGEAIDYLTFVPDGEPTLDSNLGREIELLGPLGLKIAVISNGSLIWREDVRHELEKADWVSLKVDAVMEETWRRINRPHRALQLGSILEGMRAFATPPAEEWVEPPDEEAINRAYQAFSERLDHVEYLISYEGNAFAFTGDVEEDLLSITSVHPMREEAVGQFLARAGVDRSVVSDLIAQGRVVELNDKGKRFYMRRLPKPGQQEPRG